jgi:hypothetical protein
VSKKSATKPAVPTLVPQPHGGALLTGGMPGNRGNPTGAGRPASALRNVFRKDLETARLKMLDILDRETDECEACGGTKRAMDKDIIAIFDKIAKYAIGERKESVSVDTDFMNELGAVVGHYVHDDATLEAIREEWLAILADRLGS